MPGSFHTDRVKSSTRARPDLKYVAVFRWSLGVEATGSREWELGVYRPLSPKPRIRTLPWVPCWPWHGYSPGLVWESTKSGNLGKMGVEPKLAGTLVVRIPNAKHLKFQYGVCSPPAMLGIVDNKVVR